jgi:DNA-binding IclR family transcriptional regulator/ribosomal protein L40E
MKCPKCGFENRPGARFCKQCGQTLPDVNQILQDISSASTTCPDCGAANEADAHFCSKCGRTLALFSGVTCPGCGIENSPNARFCRQCGHTLPSVDQALPIEPPSTTPMPAPAPPESVDVPIEGSVSGQVAIGNNILQIGDVHGGVVNVMAPGEKSQPKPRPTPIDLRPHPFPDLLDRDTEIKAATAALRSAQPVEFHAAAGSGKTSLLRHLAHHPAASTFPDGVIYLSVRRQHTDDLLQSLYDVFYETDIPFKPTDAQRKHDLQDKRALILLDDVELARENVETIMDTAPACTFLLASPERRLWDEGQSLELGGLPPSEALTLIERELDRPLTPRERPVAQRLRVHSKGNPLTLIQIAAEVREKGLLLTNLKAQKEQSAGMRTTDLLDFPKQQMHLVRYITREGEVTLEAAAKHLGETPANAQQMLDTLESKGYLEREEKKGKWIYKMHFAHKSARGLPPGIWNALEEGTKGEASSFANALNALPASLRQVMAALAALGGAPVHTEHLAALTDLADVTPTLKALQRRGLAQVHSPRYSLTGDLDTALQQVSDLTPWLERAATHFTAWAVAQQQTPEQLLAETDAILWILKWADDDDRWTDVLRLGRAIEGALAVGGRWAAWEQVLHWILQAGQALEDQAIEAWALHQLGTRSLCLGDSAAARTTLTQALQLRETLGDHAGAEITKHNLSLLSDAPPPEGPPEEPPPSKPRLRLPKWLRPPPESQ